VKKTADLRLLAKTYGRENNPDAKKTSAPTFHKHDWSIFLYQNLKNYPKRANLKTFTREQIYAMPEDAPMFTDVVLVDKVCSICGYNISDVCDKIDILNDIEQDRNIENFFNYYQNRCPKPSAAQLKAGDYFHIFRKDVCENCGVTKEMLLARDEKYYTKFKFAAREQKIVKSQSLALNEKNAPLPIIEKAGAMQQSIVQEIVKKTIDLFKFKKREYYNLWNYLGMTEGLVYDDILNGKETPTNFDARIGHIDIYIKELIFNYYTLANYKNVILTPEIKKIIDLCDAAALKKLADLQDFNSFTKWNKSYVDLIADIACVPAAMAGFVMEYLISGLLGVQAYLMKHVNKKVSDEFVIMTISQIIHAEKTVAQMKAQKAAAVEVNQQQTNENSYDNEQSRAYDDLVKPDDVDKFSYDEMDYSGENESINE
jgi:hypothetical protein